MSPAEMKTFYRGYIDCLNTRRLEGLDTFVADRLTYNGTPLTRADYRDMIAGDVAAIPDLRFVIDLLVAADGMVAARLTFDCTPQSAFLGIEPDGGPLSFSENVFYVLRDGRIGAVQSLIDTPAIRAQLAARATPAT